MKDAGKLRQASIGICVPSDSDRQYRTVVWCRFGGLVLSVRRPCTVGSTALYWQHSAPVPEWQSCVQRPCTDSTAPLYRNGNHAYVLAYGKDRRNGAPFDSDISAGWPNSFLFADCMILVIFSYLCHG